MAPTQITQASLVKASKDRLPIAAPWVRGPQRGFEICYRLQLESEVTGGGVGGIGGKSWTSWNCEKPVSKGYACVASDMGHSGEGQCGL